MDNATTAAYRAAVDAYTVDYGTCVLGWGSDPEVCDHCAYVVAYGAFMDAIDAYNAANA